MSDSDSVDTGIKKGSRTRLAIEDCLVAIGSGRNAQEIAEKDGLEDVSRGSTWDETLPHLAFQNRLTVAHRPKLSKADLRITWLSCLL